MYLDIKPENVPKLSRQPLFYVQTRSGGGAVDKRSRRPNPPQQQQQPMMVQRASPGQRRSRNPLESAAQRRMTEADVRDAEVRVSMNIKGIWRENQF